MSTEYRPMPPGTDSLPAVPAEFQAIGPPVARGATAVVWRARNRVTGQEVALKVWLSPLHTAEERSHFEAESRRHLELPDHPHIVRWLWAAAPADGPPWLATELHGESLGTILRRQGPYPLAAGLVVALDLLDGLAAMHRRGMVHRDVKPDNVLVTAGRAALCDLGVSMWVAEPASDRAAGTRSYLAPELTGTDPDATADFRSDVYSAARTIRLALGNDVPLAVDQLLTRAQSAEPLDRPRDAADFAGRLSKLAADAGAAVPPAPVGPSIDSPGRGSRKGGKASRRTVLIVLLAAAALLGGASAAVVMLHAANPAQPAVPTATGDQQRPAARSASNRATADVLGLPAAHVSPDIDAAGRPVLLDRRPDGQCTGSAVPGGVVDHRVDGVTVATTTLYRDGTSGTLCAYVHKSGSTNTYDKPTYLSLSLCNSAGECDSDWYDYKWRAGPVMVRDVAGCASWRVSMTDVTGSRWILRDAVGPIGC